LNIPALALATTIPAKLATAAIAARLSINCLLSELGALVMIYVLTSIKDI
jgi:hypothetical protein